MVFQIEEILQNNENSFPRFDLHLCFSMCNVLAPILAGFKGFLVPMVAWGIKIVCKKFEEFLTKIDIFLQKMVK